ncbi:MAG: hypothetical protein Q8S84_07210 [bacterium]|nr:hypothetical protein [bacterium]MDP3381245.1 hypothetical protein [bacterium]
MVKLNKNTRTPLNSPLVRGDEAQVKYYSSPDKGRWLKAGGVFWLRIKFNFKIF